MTPTLVHGVWPWVFLVLLLAATAWFSVVDLRERKVRNTHLLWAAGAVTAVTALMLLAEPASWGRVVHGAVAALALFVLWLVVALISGGVGMGDVKLALLVGYLTGVHSLFTTAAAAYAAFMLGGLVGVLLVAARRGGKVRVPFAPIMLSGAIVGVLWAPALSVTLLG